MSKQGQGKLINGSKILIQPEQLNEKAQRRRMKSYKNYRQSPMISPKHKQSNKSFMVLRKKDIMLKPANKELQEIINESSISYELSIQYKTPQKHNESSSRQKSAKNHKKETKNGGKKFTSKLFQISFDQNAVEKQEKQKNLSIIELFDRRETRDTQKDSKRSKKKINDSRDSIQLEINEKKISSKIIIKQKLKLNKKQEQNNSITSSRGSIPSLKNVIKKKSACMGEVSKKQQKLKKIQRKTNQIEENGDIEDIAKQIQKLNKKSVSQLEPSLNSIYSFSNSKSFIAQLKSSSSSQNSSHVSTKTIFKQRCLKSEQFCLSSRTIKMVRPDTDPVHNRLALMGNGLSSSMRRENIFQQPDISTISFYDDKELAVIEESICQVKSEEISLLEVEDWVKFVSLILKLDKKTFNKIVRLINKVIEPSDPMEAIFYYAGACVALYAKIQCQHMFHQQQKEFPEIPHHSEHKRAEIQHNHPILEIKQLRRAECQVSDMVNFSFELHDTLIDECLNTCQLWTKYIQANKNAIHKKPFEFFLIGTENIHQRRNYLYCSYIIDTIQFLKELTETEEAFIEVNEVKNTSHDSPVSTHNVEVKIPKNLQMILLSIFVVISSNFSQKYCPNTNSLTDSMVLVSKFSKKVFKFSEKKITYLQSLMKKAKQMQIENLLSRIELEELRKLETKTRDMKTKEEISTYIQNKTLWFRNVGHTKTHQELQWFL